MLVIVSILKIIGGVFALLILLMLAVLAVPVFYRADIDYSGELKANVRFVLFFGLVIVYIRPSSGKKFICRIFGIPFHIKKKTASESKKSGKKKALTEKEQRLKATVSPEDKNAARVKASDKTEKTADTNQKEGIMTRLRNLKASIKKILRKAADTKDKLSRLKAMLCDEDLGEAFGVSKPHLIRLLKHLSPQKTNLVVSVGLEDPADTGFLLAALSSVYPLYARWMKIDPQFDKKIFNAKGSVRGRMINCYVAWYVIKVLRNKNLKSFLNKYK